MLAYAQAGRIASMLPGYPALPAVSVGLQRIDTIDMAYINCLNGNL
jgi:hypothetical protein